MTGLDLINKFQKDLWDNSNRMFGDSFDSIFDSLSKVQSFPFYNVVKYGKGQYGIELGLAGYNKKNVKVEYKDGVLTVSGQVDDKEKEYIEKGLAFRKFYKQFSLRNDVVVDDAKMEDGVLTVKLGVNEPEEIEAQEIKVK
jgi:molecular chaperone IbpA